jgi:hypothetical protein
MSCRKKKRRRKKEKRRRRVLFAKLSKQTTHKNIIKNGVVYRAAGVLSSKKEKEIGSEYVDIVLL